MGGLAERSRLFCKRKTVISDIRMPVVHPYGKDMPPAKEDIAVRVAQIDGMDEVVRIKPKQ